MRQHIPNIISLCNIVCGTLSIYVAFTVSLEVALWLMFLAALFDLFDGFFARLLQAFSPIGKDIDSLCDVVSFGVAPAIMMWLALEKISHPLAWVAVLIVPASAYRLAKFNQDIRQTTSFIGLPTPANALFFGGLSVWLAQEQELLQSLSVTQSGLLHALLLLLILLFSYLLLSELPMFSLKEKGSGHWGVTRLVLVVLLGVVGAVLWGYLGLPIGVLAYVLLNLIHRFRFPS